MRGNPFQTELPYGKGADNSLEAAPDLARSWQPKVGKTGLGKGTALH